MTVQTIDPRLVAEFIEKLNDLRQLRGQVLPSLQHKRAVARRALNMADNEMWQKNLEREEAAKGLAKAKEALKKANPDQEGRSGMAKLRQKRSKAGRKYVKTLTSIEQGYEKVFDCQDVYIEAQEMELKANMQRTNLEREVQKLELRILAVVVPDKAASAADEHYKFQIRAEGILLRRYGHNHRLIATDGSIVELSKPVTA